MVLILIYSKPIEFPAEKILKTDKEAHCTGFKFVHFFKNPRDFL